MGRRLENWLSKASTEGTREQWKIRFQRFARWASKYMGCDAEEVDDIIRRDFEAMPSHLFQDKYRDLLTKYVSFLSGMKDNTALAHISSVRSFFSNEAAEIRLQRGKLPSPQMAMNEHRFTLPELRAMWLVGDLESKARLSAAVSLGWSIGDFMALETRFARGLVERVDEDGFASFDYLRRKTRARVRGILTPDAVQDLKAYLAKVPPGQGKLWTTTTAEGFNYWLRNLVKEAGIRQNGTMRFHLLRKYTFDTVSANCGLYEAKLLVGKKIPIADETYLHGLEDRLLERYKRFAYPLLRLSGSTPQNGNTKALEEKFMKQGQALDYLQSENVELKTQIQSLRAEVERLRTGRDTQIEELRRGLEELRKMLTDLMK
jgi:hypothetical protein